MSESSVNILLVEDNSAEARFLQEILKDVKLKKFHIVRVQRLQEALDKLSRTKSSSCPYDIILLDLSLPDSQGLESLRSILEQAPQIAIVVLTNTNDDKLALEAVRQGAQDYLVKRQVNGDLLVRSLCYAIERKQAAEALRDELKTQVNKAREINQLRSELVSMISHDFRNPLNTILASAGLLEEREDRLSEEKKQTLFRLIRNASKDMNQLLDEILLVGKADAGKLEFNPVMLDVVAFCRQLIKELEVINLKGKHRLVFSSTEATLEGLWDRNLLRHIFLNLLTNAIKYSPQGGIVSFELIRSAQQAKFSISDRGIGISPQYYQKIFQPFERANNVGQIQGTGLGLAIVKSCVIAHGGTIEVKSQLNVGTTFSAILPIRM